MGTLDQSMTKPTAFALAILILAGLAPLPVLAQDDGTLDLSTTVTGLPSTAGIYGPVSEQRLVVRLPPGHNFGIELANRTTKDRFRPAHAEYAAVDGRVDWSKHFSTTVLASVASGPPYPARRIAVQADALVHRGTVLSVGGELNSQFGIGIVRTARFGGTYYRGDGYASFMYSSSWSSVLGHMRGYLGSVAFGHPGQTTETLYAGTGSESDVNLQTPANPSLLGERETGASVSVKHWLSHGSGFHAGVGLGTLNRADGSVIYARREVTLGFFTTFGH